MGSSSNEIGDEDHINDGVESNADDVVVYLADVGRTALAHKRKHACGEFPWVHTHGWTEGDPLAQKGETLVQPLQKVVLKQGQLL